MKTRIKWKFWLEMFTISRYETNNIFLHDFRIFKQKNTAQK